jgi:anti-sigma regulatory factor (Ser/Thr protein kinase)
MDDDVSEAWQRERFFHRTRRSVPVAREFAQKTLVEWGVVGVSRRTDDVLLCVSELATNALLHGVPPGRGFLVRLGLTADRVLRIEAHDSGDGEPRPRDSAAGEERGRGLAIVEALADKWGVGERYPGKIIWCEFAV